MIGEGPEQCAAGTFGGEDLIDGGAVEVAGGEYRRLRTIGVSIGEAEDHLIGPASLIQRSVGTRDVDMCVGSRRAHALPLAQRQQTGSVVDEGFSAVHCAVSGGDVGFAGLIAFQIVSVR